LIDLRSDTLTLPTAGMQAAMAIAQVGDDVYGEDPTVNALEARVAELLGHEAGLFCATGSLVNLLGVWLLVPPGQELLCDVRAHVARAELGAHAALHGVTMRTWDSAYGVADAATIAGLMAPDAGPYLVSTAAVALENTHNFGGGTVQPYQHLVEVSQLCHDAGVSLHLDGARLWNAHVATGIDLAEYGQHFDTVSVCLSKGLGAPIGSVLAGSREQIAEARVWRKRYGGGMRQAGILAAAGLWALDHHVERLVDDHARARAFAEAVASRFPKVIDPAHVQTNIVIADVGQAGWAAAEFVAAAAERGLRMFGVNDSAVRLVWHLDVDDPDTGYAAGVMNTLIAQAGHRS